MDRHQECIKIELEIEECSLQIKKLLIKLDELVHNLKKNRERDLTPGWGKIVFC